METPAPQPAENSPEPSERKGVFAFIQSLKAPAAAEKTPKPSDVAQPLNEKGPLYHHFAEFSWSIHQNAWLKVSLIVHVALMLLIWFGAYLAFSRPTYLQVGNPTLVEAARDYYTADYTKMDPDTTFDKMSFFVISTLSMLHQIDAYGKPPLSLLHGMVRPEIVKKAQKRFDNGTKTIKAQKFVQNLVVNRILSPIKNEAQGSIAIFVEGYFSIALQDEKGDPVNAITPYRGKVLLRMTPVSNLNPFPFTLDDLEEVAGAVNVKKWDEDNKKFFQ